MRLELWPSCSYTHRRLSMTFWSEKKVALALKCAFIGHRDVLTYELSNVCGLCLVYISVTHRDECDISCSVQRIVGQKSRPAFIQNMTGCGRTCWYFWNTAFHILRIGTTQNLFLAHLIVWFYRYGNTGSVFRSVHSPLWTLWKNCSFYRLI